MNYTWNKNLKLLKNRFPSLYKLYEKQILLFEKNFSENLEKIDFWQISKAKNGEPTISENNKFLHSSYNPQREASGIISNLENKSNIIFLGFGLGYQVIEASKYILNNKNKQKLILIENDIRRFFAAICILDWEDVFKVSNLVLALACPENQIISLIENGNSIVTINEGVSNSFIFKNVAFTNHSQNYFNTIVTLIERNKTKNEINTATYKKFSKLWIKNSIQNLEQIKIRKSVNQFLEENKDKLKKDFILVAAGPSLQKILPYLKELKKYYYIITVETALHAMLNFNVEPDFIVITDPQYYAFRHILGLKSLSSILICPITVHPAVFRFECKEILLCSDFTPVTNFFESQTNKFGDLGAGGSVASCAWTFAKLCCAKNIYLAGLDLSYPQKQTHIKGSSAEQNFFKNSKRINPVEKMTLQNMYSSNPEYSQDYNGNPVLTDSKMKMFAWWFESKIATETKLKTFSLNEQSMKIPGIQTINVEELLNSVKNTSFSENKNNFTFDNKYKNIELFEKNKELFFLEYKNLLYLINRAIELCIINSPQLLNELNQIEQELFNSKLNEFIKYAYKKENNPIETFLNLKKFIPVL